MTRRLNASWAAALAAGLLLTLSGCGGSGSAAATETQAAERLGEKVSELVAQVDKMGIMEWHGQLLTKNPDKGGKRLLDLNGRFSRASGYMAISMDSTLDGKSEQVDYLVLNDRIYFNSENWGPGSDDCWAEVTDAPAYSWALPTELDPTWPLRLGRPVGIDGDDLSMALSFKQVLGGLPRGLFPAPPSVPYDTEAKAFVAPHSQLLEVGIDVQGLWNQIPKAQRATFDTRGTGWWAMTMKQSNNDASIAPPKYLFDPAVTPPSKCQRG